MLRAVVQISPAQRRRAQEVIDRQIVEGTKKPYANDILLFTRSGCKPITSYFTSDEIEDDEDQQNGEDEISIVSESA